MRECRLIGFLWEMNSIMDDVGRTNEFLVHVARLGLSGRVQDVQAYLKRIIKKVERSDRELSESLKQLLATTPATSATREAGLPFVPSVRTWGNCVPEGWSQPGRFCSQVLRASAKHCQHGGWRGGSIYRS